MTFSGERLDAVVAEAVAGNRDALREVLETIRPIVVRYCRARIGRRSEVVSQPTTLLRRCAWPPSRRCRATRIRDDRSWPLCTASPRTRLPTHIARRPEPRRADRCVPERLSMEAGPEQMAIDAESSARMNRLLAVLPEKQREILILRVVVGMSAEETAEAVGSTAGAVRVAQHRALARLKAEIRRRGTTMPDFGRWTANGGDPSLNEINRDGPLPRRARHPTSRCTRPIPARRSSRSCSSGWRDEVRDAPVTTLVTIRDAVIALHGGRRRGVAQADPHLAGPRRFGRRGGVVPRRIRCRGVRRGPG